MAFLALRELWEFSLRLLLRNYARVNVKKPMWSMDHTNFKNKLVLAMFNRNWDNFRKNYVSLNIRF